MIKDEVGETEIAERNIRRLGRIALLLGYSAVIIFSLPHIGVTLIEQAAFNACHCGFEIGRYMEGNPEDIDWTVRCIGGARQLLGLEGKIVFGRASPYLGHLYYSLRKIDVWSKFTISNRC